MLSFAGSTSYTSIAAPATFPDPIASFKSFSLTRPPLAQLIIKTPSLQLLRDFLLMIFLVWSVIGT